MTTRDRLSRLWRELGRPRQRHGPGSLQLDGDDAWWREERERPSREAEWWTNFAGRFNAGSVAEQFGKRMD